MVKYTCDRCGKEFKQKGHLIEHKNKKKPCIEIINNLQIPPINLHNPPINFQILPINLQNLSNNFQNNDDVQNFYCGYCNKNFGRRDNLNRHLKERCKVKKEDDEYKKNIFELLVEKERLINSNLQNEVSDLKKQLADLSKTIKELTNKTTTVINNNNNNYGNINNIVIPSDKLAKFGKEDLTKITHQEFLKIRNQQGIAIFKECAKLIYNNKSFNRTVYVADVSRKKAMIWDGKDWILSDLVEAVSYTHLTLPTKRIV